MMVVSILCGIILAICMGYMLAGLILNRSNNQGDSKVRFKDIAPEGIRILEKQDNVDPNLKLEDLIR